MILPIELTCGTLPLNFSGTPLQYCQAIRNRFKGVVPDNKVITGYKGVSDPGINLGPWFRQDPILPGLTDWWSPSLGSYVPAPYYVGPISGGTIGREIKLVASPTADRVQELQNATGTIALLYDIYVPRPTKILSGTDVLIDCRVAESFIHRLTANSVHTLLIFPENNGGKILLALQNNGTAYTTTFKAYLDPDFLLVQWPNNHTIPAVPAGTAGKNAVGLYEFIFNNGDVYAKLLTSSAASPATEIDIDPGETAPPNYGQIAGGSSGPPAHHIL